MDATTTAPETSGPGELARRRRAFVALERDAARSAILEIGALDRPLYRRPAFDVRYVDVFSDEELRESFAARPRRRRSADRLVPVDYVTRDTTISEAVDFSPDLVVACHLFEHLPDPVGWLIDLARIATPRTRLFLAQPDKRTCFDRFRAETDAIDWYRRWREGARRPDKWDLLRARTHQTGNDVTAILAGTAQPMPRRVPDLDAALREIEALGDVYTDTHCSILTPERFAVNLHVLGGIVPWRVSRIAPAEPETTGRNEFLVMLEPTGA
ncbi:MAG: hypothetical protein ACU0BS_02970 [Hasllibacter sp.]